MNAFIKSALILSLTTAVLGGCAVAPPQVGGGVAECTTLKVTTKRGDTHTFILKGDLVNEARLLNPGMGTEGHCALNPTYELPSGATMGAHCRTAVNAGVLDLYLVLTDNHVVVGESFDKQTQDKRLGFAGSWTKTACPW